MQMFSKDNKYYEKISDIEIKRTIPRISQIKSCLFQKKNEGASKMAQWVRCPLLSLATRLLSMKLTER